MGARPQAHAALPLRVADGGVGGGWLGDTLGGVHHHAGAAAERVPGAVGAAQLRRDGLVEHVAVDRRERSGLSGEFDVGRIGRHQQIGWRVLALGDEAFTQLGVLAGGEAHLDAGGGGERLEHRLDAVVPAGVHGDDLPIGTAG